MPTGAKTLVSVVVGIILGWFLLAGFCWVPGIRGSEACGDGVVWLLPLFLPIGIVLCWFALSRIARNRR